jgi:hypothetical protein
MVNSIFVADFDGDGRDDLIIRMKKQLIVFYMDSNGKFESRPYTSMDDVIGEKLISKHNVVFMDYNGDGRDDLVIVKENGHFELFKNNIDSFKREGIFDKLPERIENFDSISLQNSKILVGDFDGSGKQSMLFICPKTALFYLITFNHVAPAAIQVQPVTANLLGLDAPRSINEELARSNNFFVSDINGDDRDELIFRASDGQLTILFHNDDASEDFTFYSRPTSKEDPIVYRWSLGNGKYHYPRSDKSGIATEGTMHFFRTDGIENAGLIMYSPLERQFKGYLYNGNIFESSSEYVENDQFTRDFNSMYPKWENEALF